MSDTGQKPKRVRNFYFEAKTNGKTVAGGPNRKDGDLVITVYMRKDGEAVKAFDIYCGVGTDGVLFARASKYDTFWTPGDEVLRIESER